MLLAVIPSKNDFSTSLMASAYLSLHTFWSLRGRSMGNSNNTSWWILPSGTSSFIENIEPPAEGPRTVRTCQRGKCLLLKTPNFFKAYFRVSECSSIKDWRTNVRFRRMHFLQSINQLFERVSSQAAINNDIHTQQTIVIRPLVIMVIRDTFK